MKLFLARSTALRQDPRYYQIATLSVLLVYGLAYLDFEVHAVQAGAILATALGMQYVLTRLQKLPAFDPKSALISGLSLCLLLRTNMLSVAALAAAFAIASKFILRWNGKHVFNPTNIGLVGTILLTGQVWVSPGQWGNAALFGFLMACLGGLVVNRALRSDVTYAFLVSYVLIFCGRALWLGDPMSIPLHQLANGAFLLFAFFMISDPKTTPNSRAGRILFAFLVAAGAGFVQFGLYRTNGLFWSLALFALTVPIIDRLLPGRPYEWKHAAAALTPSPNGDSHETSVDSRGNLPPEPALRPGRPGVLRFLRGESGHEAFQQGVAGRPRSTR